MHHPTRFSSLTILTIVTAVILAGCDKCSKEKDNAALIATSENAETNALIGEQSGSPEPATTVEPIVGAENIKTLQIKDEKVGTGEEAVDGKTVSVFYTGTLTDGTKFDSTKDRGTPFSFVLGSGMVITGWDQGIKGMKAGGTRRLIIPPDLAYGDKGVGNVIPPNATLVFDVELLKVE